MIFEKNIRYPCLIVIKPGMTIFGHAELSRDGSNYVHNTTVLDSLTNAVYGSLLIILIPIGLGFNCLVYAKNHMSSRTPSSVIYRCLAFFDLLICVFRGGQQVVTLLSPTQEPFYSHEVPSNWRLTVAVVTLCSGICLNTVIMLLTMVRFFTLVFPFDARIRADQITVFVLCYIGLTCVVSTGVGVHYFLHKCVYWSTVTQWIVPCASETTQYVIDVIIPLACTSLTTIFSLMTVAYLVVTSGGAHWRSSMTVLLMSLGMILWNVMLFVTSSLLPIDYEGMSVYLEEGEYWVYYYYYLVSMKRLEFSCG